MVLLFEDSGKNGEKNIPTMLLQGKSGAGKTFLAEKFAEMIGAEEKFVQCFPRMGAENFHKDIDAETMIDKQVNGDATAQIMLKAIQFYAESIGKTEEFYKIFQIDKDKPITEQDLKDNRSVVQMGIILQALEQSKHSPVVITIDELDKARPEVDSFLLDFLENGRLTTGTESYTKGKYPIYCVITSNDKRKIDEALINRSRKIDVPRPEKDLFLEILGLPEDHYLGYIYAKCPNFSIRQAKQYMKDLEVLGTEIDEDALSQYINLDELDVMSLADLQYLSELDNGELEFDLPDLERCSLSIASQEDAKQWIEIIQKDNPQNFSLYADENENGNMYVYIDTVEQLETVCEHIEFDSDDYYGKTYNGWFEYAISDEELESANIMWASNKSENNGTRFGIKIDDDRMFRVAMNRGSTFVYLDSKNNTLERFLGKEKSETEQEYETDNGYEDDGRDYDD